MQGSKCRTFWSCIENEQLPLLPARRRKMHEDGGLSRKMNIAVSFHMVQGFLGFTGIENEMSKLVSVDADIQNGGFFTQNVLGRTSTQENPLPPL